MCLDCVAQFNMDYSTEKEGIKRRKVMSTEVFETPEPKETFQPYARANSSSHSSHGATSMNPEVEGHFYDKSFIELDGNAIPATQAFEVFMGKTFKPALLKQTEYEASSRTSSHTFLESPLVRFTRLTLELKELEEDLTLLATDAEQKKHRVMVDASQEAELRDVMQGLSTLQLNLSALEQNAAFQPFVRSSATALHPADTALRVQQDLTAKFFHHIDALKRQQRSTTPASSSSASSDTAPIVYEIYSTGELHAVDRDAKTRIAALEARLVTLEKAIGCTQGHALPLDGSSLLNGAFSGNLTAAVAHLEQRVALMSEKNLDAVRTRTTALVHEFTLLSKLKQSSSVQGALTSQADREQLQQMHDQLGHLDAVAASVPTLVDRLMTLKSVHNEAIDVNARMATMEQTQTTLGELLASDQCLLANMEASLAENVQRFQSNIQHLDERMANLLNGR